MDLIVAGERIPVAVTERVETESPYTGRQLDTLEVEFRLLSVDARERFAEMLRDRDATVESESGKRYEASLRSQSYQDASPITHFTVELKEVEEIRATRVVIDGSLALVPDRYDERYDDGAIAIRLTTTTTEALTDQLEAAITGGEQYFPVVREGVQEEPLEVRFGRCLWEDQPDGSRKHFIVLVERSWDEERDRPPFKGPHEPEIRRLEEAVASLQSLVRDLADQLVAAGTLSAVDVDAISERTKAVAPPQLRQFDRAKDIDDFFR